MWYEQVITDMGWKTHIWGIIILCERGLATLGAHKSSRLSEWVVWAKCTGKYRYDINDTTLLNMYTIYSNKTNEKSVKYNK